MTNGWQEVPLGKVLKRADRFEKKDELQTYHFAGTYSFARGIFAGETKEGSTFRLDKIQRIKKGDFIYCKIMAWEGAFGIAPEKVDDCVMSGAFVAYEVDQTQIDPKYLDYYFKQEPVWKTIGSQSTGTNVRRRSLHPHQFEKATIPLPPLTEQRRIVAHIESLAARVNEAQRLREEVDHESAVLLDTAIGKVFSELKAKEVKPLKDLATKIGSGSTPKGGRAIYQQSGIPFIRSMNVRMRQFQWSDIAYIDSDIHESMSGTKVKPKDVLLNITGASIGRVACAPDNLVEANVNQHVTIIRPVETLDYRFLMYWLSQPAIQDFINDEQKGATRQGFTKAQIEQFEIPILPLDEQRRIVAYLDGLQAKVNALRELQVKGGEELSALMASVLDRAFKGEL